MRFSAVACVALVALTSVALAGCTEDTDARGPRPDAADSLEAAYPLWTHDAATVLDGSTTWHDHGSDLFGMFLSVYAPVTQPAFHPCLYDGEPYFNNLHLSGRLGSAPVPNGTTHLAVTLSWPAEAYAGDGLILAYKAANTTTYRESDYLINGETGRIPVTMDDWDADKRQSNWDFWVCVAGDGDSSVGSSNFRPRLFNGELTAHIEATQDLAALDEAQAAPAEG